MTMRVSLIIDGDPKGAKAAVAATEADLNRLGKTATETQAKLNSVKPPVQPVQQFGQAVQLSAGELTNMQFQLQDMAIGLASGQSPFTVMMQQGSQMAQMFRSGTGVMGALRAVGGGVVQFITNPLNAAVLGFGVFASAAVAAFNEISSGWPSASDAITRHDDLVKRVGDSWDSNLAKLKAYAVDSRAVLAFEAMRESGKLQKSFQSATGELAIAGGRNTGGARIAGVSETTIMATGSAELKAITTDFFNSVKAGKPDVLAFRDALAQLGSSTPDDEVKKLVGAMLEQSRAAASLQQEMQQNKDLVDGLKGNTRAMNDALGTASDKVGGLTQRIGELSRAASFAVAERGGLNAPWRTQASSQNDFVGKSLLDLIATAEGTAQGRNYNETLGYGKFTGGDVDLVTMKISEVLDLQKRMLADPSNTFNSSAVGRYQITAETLRDFMPRLGLDGNTIFGPQVQDALARAIINSTGGDVGKMQGRWEGLQKVTPGLIRNSYEADFEGRSGVASQVANVGEQDRIEKLKEQEVIKKRLLDQDTRWASIIANATAAETSRSEAIGKSVGEQARLRMEEQLWQQARSTFGDRLEKDKKLHADVTAAIRDQAQAYGLLAQKKMEDAKFSQGREVMARQEIEHLDQIRSVGGDILRNTFQQAEATGTLKGAWNGALDSIKSKLLDLLESGLDDMLFGAKGSSSKGVLGGVAEGIGSLIGSVFGSPGLYAKGATFAGGITAFAAGASFSNTIVDQPTLFRYGGSELGVMGEKGEEAIMPLKGGKVLAMTGAGQASLPLTRMGDGSLGVDMRQPRPAAGQSPVAAAPGVAAFAAGASFTSTIVDQPSFFRSGGADPGMMALWGEAGQETMMPFKGGKGLAMTGEGQASLPLTRMGDGSLGADMRAPRPAAGQSPVAAVPGVAAFAAGASLTNTIVDQPTFFRSGGADPGMMALLGEAGQETIMPLKGGKVLAMTGEGQASLPLTRMGDGSLGVDMRAPRPAAGLSPVAAVPGVAAFAAGASFTNTIVDQPTFFRYGGNQLGVMGEAGEEAIMPLKGGKVLAMTGAGQGSLPLTRMGDGSLGVDMRGPKPFALGASFGGSASGAPGGGGEPTVNLNVHNYGSDKVEAKATKGQNGEMNLDVVVGQMVNQHIAKGGADQALGQRFTVNKRVERHGS